MSLMFPSCALHKDEIARCAERAPGHSNPPQPRQANPVGTLRRTLVQATGTNGQLRLLERQEYNSAVTSFCLTSLSAFFSHPPEAPHGHQRCWQNRGKGGSFLLESPAPQDVFT